MGLRITILILKLWPTSTTDTTGLARPKHPNNSKLTKTPTKSNYSNCESSSSKKASETQRNG